ncbi:hypothetical protein BC829DRAFT_38548 [Chytridium lagenaria]|nr:hypothetical protein BC829DRAFT_38548 [Chytridium lagenaria]
MSSSLLTRDDAVVEVPVKFSEGEGDGSLDGLFGASAGVVAGADGSREDGVRTSVEGVQEDGVRTSVDGSHEDGLRTSVDSFKEDTLGTCVEGSQEDNTSAKIQAFNHASPDIPWKICDSK